MHVSNANMFWLRGANLKEPTTAKEYKTDMLN
jgi:hypothetical protein